MKKLIFILSTLLFFAATIEAQNMRRSDTYFSRTVNTEVGDADSTWASSPIAVNKEYPYIIDFAIAIDSLKRAADDTIFIKLQGKVFQESDWTDIDTVYNLLPTAQTLSIGSKDDDLVKYRFLRIFASSKDKDSNWRVTTYQLKLHKGLYYGQL